MPYADQAAIEKLIPSDSLIQLTNDDATGSVIDVPNLDQALTDADEEINAYLRGRYGLPLSPVPPFVVKIAVDLAVWNLYSRRPESEMPETVKERQKNALRSLAKIQSGMLHLGTDSGLTPEPGEYKTNKTTESKVFTDTVLDKLH